MIIEYGIVCGLNDETKLVKNVNSFLVKQCGFRKMYKWPDRSIKPVGKPFEIDHYYTQFLKESSGWLFDIKPNYDKAGRLRFGEHPECGWTLFTKPYREQEGSEALQEIEIFFKSLLESIGFPTVELHSYKESEDRI